MAFLAIPAFFLATAVFSFLWLSVASAFNRVRDYGNRRAIARIALATILRHARADMAIYRHTLASRLPANGRQLARR